MEVKVKENLIYPCLLTQILEVYPQWNCADPTKKLDHVCLVDFDPCKAIEYGILGINKPTVTRCGIESIACCNALNGWG